MYRQAPQARLAHRVARPPQARRRVGYRAPQDRVSDQAPRVRRVHRNRVHRDHRVRVHRAHPVQAHRVSRSRQIQVRPIRAQATRANHPVLILQNRANHQAIRVIQFR